MKPIAYLKAMVVVTLAKCQFCHLPNQSQASPEARVGKRIPLLSGRNVLKCVIIFNPSKATCSRSFWELVKYFGFGIRSPKPQFFFVNVQKTKIMASGPITSWHIDGETMETVRGFIFLGSKITADGDAATKLKDLLFGRKVMINLDSTLKSRGDIALPTKVRLVKAMVFPVVMYGCESWTIKKAEC